MTITYPITVPELPGYISFAWAPESAVARQPSEFTLESKVYVWAGQKRAFTARLGPLYTMAMAKSWQSFFNQLNGSEGTFLANDPAGSLISGSLSLDEIGTNSVTVLHAGAGNSFTADGWPINRVGLLASGDWVAIDHRLYQLMADAHSNGAGEMDLLVWPAPCGTLPVDAIVSVGPEAFGEFRLVSFPETTWNVEKWMDEGLTFTAEEAI